MADDGSGEKTEEPTHKKLQDARKKGQVWKSKDLSGVMVFVVGLGVVKGIFPMLEGEVAHLFAYGLDRLSHPEDLIRAIHTSLFMGLWSMLLISIPVVIGCAIAGAITDFLQVGALFA